MDLRLIIDPAAPGDWNMGLDEALLQSASGAGQGACLRFYFWQQPTLSLGYFQRCTDRQQHPASLECPLVRRCTGGGAILHAQELTYSFTAPTAWVSGGSGRDMYMVFHETLMEELATRSVSAAICRPERCRSRQEEPFLCFQRRSCGDVLVGDFKVAGSAQRRHRGALLQHGSVLLRATPRAPELPGIEDLHPVAIDAQSLATRWAQRASNRLGWRLVAGQASEKEIVQAEYWRQHKFCDPQWTRKR